MKINSCFLMIFIFQCLFLSAKSQQCATRGGCHTYCQGSECFSDSRSLTQCCGTKCKDFNSIPVYQHNSSLDYFQCNTQCPAKYYKDDSDTSHRKCSECHEYCQTCTNKYNYTCKSCDTDAYKLNDTACYNLPATDNNYSTVAQNIQNPCISPYYGLQITKTCQNCPIGCTSCNIYLKWQMPQTYLNNGIMNSDCPKDNLCRYMLRCYTCDSDYFLEEGQCISRQTCGKYATFLSSSGTFSSADCHCTPNYYKIASSCIICSLKCLTCTSSTDTACTSCPEGAELAAGSCNFNTTYEQVDTWQDQPTISEWTIIGRPTTNSGNATNCEQNKYVFGYYGYDNTGQVIFPSDASLTYVSTIDTKHYGLHLRGKLLFIDEWSNDLGIIFRQNNIDRFIHHYRMAGLGGQYLCGWNIPDHHDIIDNWFEHAQNTINLFIKANKPKHAWGISTLTIQKMVCHSSCLTCDGPTQTDCLSCDSAKFQVLVQGDCVCDTANHYYLSAGSCTTTCPTTQYKNQYTRDCVAICEIPNQFQYTDSSSIKLCVQSCPNTHYRQYNNKTCLSDCFDTTISDASSNYYNYDGADKVCYQQCPGELVGDPLSHNCVTQCPKTSLTDQDGYFSLNGYCVQECSSTTYAYPLNRECLTQCPTGYYKNIKTFNSGTKNVCEVSCTVTLTGLKPYADNTSKSCVDYCPTDSYADEVTRQCLKNCNSSAYRQQVIISSQQVRTCETTCDSANNDLYGNPVTGHCSAALQCPLNYFADSKTTFCQTNCTDSDQFGDNTTKKCQSNCSSGFKHNYTKTCVKTCPNANYDSKAEYGVSSGFCVQNCPPNFYSDNQTNRQCVSTCAASPAATYGQNGKCVFNCSNTLWADPFHFNRLCISSCSYNASFKTYGYNQTRKCVEVCPDTQFGIIIASVPLCVFTCQASQNLFGNILNHLCVQQCPSPYYGSPIGNRLCVQYCPDTYFSLNMSLNGTITADRICVSNCNTFGWADQLTRSCAILPEGCSQNLFAHETNHQCVNATLCTGFGDPITRKCQTTCFSNSTVKYFGDSSSKMCVLVCPQDSNTYGDNGTNQCNETCSQTGEVRDSQNMRRCVIKCSRSPLALYADRIDKTCVTSKNCTTDYFADNETNDCEIDCQGTTLLYADPVSRQCVSVCQLGYYARNTSIDVGICVQTCPLPEWADNLTVKCTQRCSVNTYGVNFTNFGTCQTECPLNQFARDTDNLCVSNCEDGLWGQTVSRRCLDDPKKCPQGYYADDILHLCVVSVQCSKNGSDIQLVADNISKKCISQCPTTIPYSYADLVKKLCVQTCPYDKFGDNNTKQCLSECKNTTSNTYTGEFADPQLRICVQICSAAPMSTFGENSTFTCVEAKYCPNSTFGQIQVYNRQCRPFCPLANEKDSNPLKYAHEVWKICVTKCPDYYYGNELSTGRWECVVSCPNSSVGNKKQFRDNLTKKCVQICPASEKTWGDQIALSCVTVCPINWYAQEVPTRFCVQVCSANSWAEVIKRTCVTRPLDCPTINGSHYYADDQNHKCVKTCPSAPLLWGQNSTWSCVSTCVTGFKYNMTRVCIDICPASFDGDGLFSDQGLCLPECITANYFRDPQNSRSCQSTCLFTPLKYYADNTSMSCVLKCPSYPSYTYADDDVKACLTSCPSLSIIDDFSRKCVDKCPNNTFFDSQSDSCVSQCPTDFSTGFHWYGDTTQSIPKCVLALNCPSSHFADDNAHLCVQTCSNNQWKYDKYCITHCPDDYYGNYFTGFCVSPLQCPNNYYADNSSRTCVAVCPGTFADIPNKICIYECTGSHYADPITHKCSTSCTNNASVQLHKNDLKNTCEASCVSGNYLNPSNNKCQSSCSGLLFADTTTHLCVDICPSSPQLYSQNSSHSCVAQCNSTNKQFKYVQGRICVTVCPATYFKNNFTRYCVQKCQNNTFADSSISFCVTSCSPNYALADPSNICTATCPEPYFKDPLNHLCVLTCPQYPSTYYKVIISTDRSCKVDCPSEQFRNMLTFQCVTICPPSPPTFSDPDTANCVAVCSDNYYAYEKQRTCVRQCPGNMLADPVTRKCVDNCIEGTNYYADSTLAVPSCVTLCSPNTFANLNILRCVTECDTYFYGFQNTTHRVCVNSCPFPLVTDDSTHQCEIKCNSITLPYLDLSSKSCVSICSSLTYQFSYLASGNTINGQCVKFCPGGSFALLSNNSCVQKCPEGLYGDITNNTCYANCTIANNKFADSSTHMCVSQCTHNSSYDSYADLFSRTCVTSCPDDKNTYSDTHTHQCQPRCSNITEYADLNLKKCVSRCPTTPSIFYADPVTQNCLENCSIHTNLYAYQTDQICISKCPINGLYANEENRKCVSAINCQLNYYGLDPERICVRICPTTPDLYADDADKLCKLKCPTNFYADQTTRKCVSKCPSVPALYSQNDTDRCVRQCPSGSYADNYTRNCIKVCSIVLEQTFADNSTNRCVKICPTNPNFFASNQTWQCVYQCPLSPIMYSDYSTRSCVKFCPGQEIDTYADDSNRTCLRVCPLPNFMENSTRKCIQKCTIGFADPLSRFCIEVCPANTYGLTDAGFNTCQQQCPVKSPALYAEDANRLCMTQCKLEFGTFRQLSSRKCVKICPINQFAQTNTRNCLSQCPQSPLLFADFSTGFCVSKCPQVPALFANSSRVCTANCPDGTWADNKSRSCIQLCPSSQNTFGDNSTWSCVSKCPTQPMTWGDPFSHICVPKCPSTPDYFADNNTRQCGLDCSQNTFAEQNSRRCVQTCPNSYYGHNTSRRCAMQCPDKQFADHLMHLCVAKCSINPIYYGNPDNHRCVQQCPSNTISFGNPLTQQCVKLQSNGLSGCNETYFSDNSTRLCVAICPMKQDTYSDNSTRKCVSQCPGGSVNTFSDNSTMRCVSECPSYPEYYAEQYFRRCVFLCLQANNTFKGSFADNSSRKCVQQCPSDPDYYSDNSTHRCVLYCPRNPLTFADNSTRRCVIQCPQSPDLYGDLSTLRCVEMCPQNQQTYADNSTHLCVQVCPQNKLFFGQNITNRCVKDCPFPSLADKSNRLCVSHCTHYPQTFGDHSTHRCVPKCPQTPSLFANLVTFKCVADCENGTYADNSSRKCLSECPHAIVNYADNYTNRCVSKCPASELTYGSNVTNQCVSKCPSLPSTYADNTTQMCLTICLNETDSGYADNVSRICVIKCPDSSYGDKISRYCLRYCPNGWYAYSVTNLCVDQCPSPYFGDHTTWKCVLKCPVSQLIFGSHINRTCTQQCPDNTYADFESQQCVNICPSKHTTTYSYDTFGYAPNKTCVDQCPSPLYGYPVTYICLSQCPNPYYENITDHRCYKCPNECSECNYPQMCLFCITNHYLYAGACVQSCPTQPSITYSNPNGKCGTSQQCTAGYFALNVTKSCVQNCPLGFYKNNSAQTCDECSKGCSQCRNSTYCLSCHSSLGIWNDYKCFIYCSPQRKYYGSTGCVSSCPDGTYLNFTSCQTCSSICNLCHIQAENCLTCANGLYLSNNICVDKCPTNYKPILDNQTMECKSCSEIDCTEQQLTYQLLQYVENFQQKIRLQFSEQISLSKTVDQIFVIKERKVTTRRMQVTQKIPLRLLTVVYELVNYTIVDYGNGIYVFILDQYNGTNADAQFEFQIIAPEAIKSLSGSKLPDKTRSTFIVEESSNYGLSQFNSYVYNYTLVILIIIVIMLIMSCWAEHSLWMPAMDVCQLLFSLFFININLPPTPTYVLGIFRISALTFLPNFFTNSLPHPEFSTAINSSVFDVFGDFVFLRTMGYLYFIMIICTLIVCTMFILSRVCWSKKIKKWCKLHLYKSILHMHLHGLVYILWLPISLMFLLNMRDYQLSQGILGFSIFNSYLFTLVMISAITYLTYKIYILVFHHALTYLLLQKAYNFIRMQKIILKYNPQYYFTHETNEIDLTHRFHPTVNGHLIIGYPVHTSMTPWHLLMPIINYLHKFLTAVFIAASFSNPIIQLFMLILLHILYAIYLDYHKPYLRIGYLQFNNQVMIHNILIIVLIMILMLVFEIMKGQLIMLERVIIGNIICALILYTITANMIYFAYQVYQYYYHHIWKVFITTQIFKDNYTIQHLQLTKKYQTINKQYQAKTKSRKQFIEAVKLDENQQKQVDNRTISRINNDLKNVRLRPSKNQALQQDLTQMFKNIHHQQQKSQKSLRSSERLSKDKRNKVRANIFEKYENKHRKNDYQPMKMVGERQNSIQEQQISNQALQEQQYEYEYIEQTYPEGTAMDQILQNCKKGDIILP